MKLWFGLFLALYYPLYVVVCVFVVCLQRKMTLLTYRTLAGKKFVVLLFEFLLSFIVCGQLNTCYCSQL